LLTRDVLAHFTLRKPANFTLGALLVPLFGPLLEKRSDKSLEGFRRFGLAVLKVAKWCFWVGFDHS